MCGIAGIIDLTGQRTPDPSKLAAMAAAIVHRGPDEGGFFWNGPVGLANRRLSIIGLADGRQPIFNEDRSIVVVFNGEFFDYPEKKAWLTGRGHQFRTSCDTELLVHLYEDFGEEIFTHLKGQFAFCLFDRRRRKLILGRDRLGICPLHWARRGDWFYFGSEIKAILASGDVKPEADLMGVDHIFTFFAMATRRTAFTDINSVLPGAYLTIELPTDGRPATVEEKRYWDLDFPDAGAERRFGSDQEAVDAFREKFDRAVEIRLRAEVPVVAYLSGGVDSTTVAVVASRIRQAPIPTFTIQIPSLDETDRAMMAAKIIGSTPTIVRCDSPTIAAAFPGLVEASDCPVVDTSCAALCVLAEEVHRQGFKVALTGEGADEALAGYPWFKINKILRTLDFGGFRPSNWARRAYMRVNAPHVPWSRAKKVQELVGGPQAQLELYGVTGLARKQLFSTSMWEFLGDRTPYHDLPINVEKVKRWSPINQSLYLGYKLMLPGLLMNHKGDRPAMRSSLETRYPFLDEDFVDFCAGIDPKYKLKGYRRDKHLLRLAAKELLPTDIADRPKAMFRAPFANSFFDSPPAWANQLMSPESLAKTGMFDVEGVQSARSSYLANQWSGGRRLSLEMGLTAVMTTQLWSHLYLGAGLCDLPVYTPRLPTEFPTPTADME